MIRQLKPQMIQYMEKEQRGILQKHQLRKERVAAYPYYIVSAVYAQDPEYLFLASVDYYSDTTTLSLNTFRRDMTKLNTISISLTSILTRKIVSTLFVKTLNFKATPSGVSLLSGEFVIGYLSGHLVLVQYRDKQTAVKTRLNRALKGEGILSKTSSFFFGGEESYPVYFKHQIKGFQANPGQTDLAYSYQVGNTIMFTKELNENLQYNFFNVYESNNLEDFSNSYDLNSTAEKGALTMFACEEYYSIKDTHHKISLINFEQEVASYVFLPHSRHEIAVALSLKEKVLIIQTTKFTLTRKLQTQMTIRRLRSFEVKNQHFLAIMVYENYLLLYNLNTDRYYKLGAHRSYVAGVVYHQDLQMLISAGMDHRVCLTRFQQLKETGWHTAQVQAKSYQIRDMSEPQNKFPIIYSGGQYDNVRTNLHNYGYADVFLMGGHFCMPTYDARILIYRYG